MFLEKTLIEICRPNLYAYFGTFCFSNGQFFEAHWAFEESSNIDKSPFSNENVADFEFL